MMCLTCAFACQATDEIVFTTVLQNGITPVKNQNRSGTCWAYATIGYIEAELLRTTGKVYENVLARERRGGYLGKTVQMIPHITDEIKHFIYGAGRLSNADVVITEVGGTIGDIEGQPFLEAIRQVGREVGRENALYIHVTLVPYLKASGEHKSKPTQHSVKELQSFGISPDVIVLRCDEPITDRSIFEKISGFCGVEPDCVIENLTLPVLYDAPLYLEEANFSRIVCRKLGIEAPEPDLSEWKAMTERVKNTEGEVVIALVGKYTRLHDAYLSVAEALSHAGYRHGVKVKIRWIDSEFFKPSDLEGADGVLVPGGFGDRGIEGMIQAARFARENGMPYLGICLGMQIMCIEYARNMLGWEDANSGEFDPTSEHRVIDFLPGQSDLTEKGGTLRLGSWPCRVKEGTTLSRCYGKEEIAERHRHRYEVNNRFRPELEEKGLAFSGVSPDGRLVEAAELSELPFFVGVQYHPEFKSRPTRPHPLFLGLVEAAMHRRAERE